MAQDPAWEQASMYHVCSANKISAQAPPALPPKPLPHTLYLQDEAAIGHPCPAGHNAGVESGVGDLCLGDPNPWDGEETSAPGDPLLPKVTLSHFRVQQWPFPHANLAASPKACG